MLIIRYWINFAKTYKSQTGYIDQSGQKNGEIGLIITGQMSTSALND